MSHSSCQFLPRGGGVSRAGGLCCCHSLLFGSGLAAGPLRAQQDSADIPNLACFLATDGERGHGVVSLLCFPPPPEIQALKPRNTDPPTQYCTGLEVAIYQATVVTSANTYTALTVGHSPLHDCCNDPMRQTLRHPFCKRGILRPERRGSALNSSLI